MTESLLLNQHNRDDLTKEIPSFTFPFDVVFHAAGKAHVVPKNQRESDEFFSVNVNGTMNLCKGLEQVGVPRQFIYISSVAVYGVENGSAIDESTALSGMTPYALSKVQAERYLIEWCKLHQVRLIILRPSLIAGVCPPGNLGAMINGLRHNRYVSIAGGKAHKSIVMAEDFARLLPLIRDIEFGIFNICADYAPSFRELEHCILEQLGKTRLLNIPYGIMYIFARLGDCLGEKSIFNRSKLRKITSDLTFSNQAIKEHTNWNPLDVLTHFKIQ